MLLLKNLVSSVQTFAQNLIGDDVRPIIFSNILIDDDDTLFGYGLIGMAYCLMEEFQHNKIKEAQVYFYSSLARNSQPEKDVRRRIAVAKIFNKFWKMISTDFSITGEYFFLIF